MTKISNNGTYLIQLKWSIQRHSSPQIYLLIRALIWKYYLNASVPLPNAKSVPQKETKNVSGETTLNASGFNQPEILQRQMSVDAPDISIYDNKGHVLWNKTDEMPRAGSGFERVTFSKPYKGDITIQINNIKSAAAAAARGSTIDSVKFATKVS